MSSIQGETLVRRGCAVLLVLQLALVPLVSAADASPAAVPDLTPERPSDWRCDETGLIVCAGANAGATVDCGFVEAGVAQCSWKYGQIMGAASPSAAPGEGVFDWSAEIETCLTHADLQPISCSSTTDAGSDSCIFVGPVECTVSQGPNPGETDPTPIEVSQCLLVTVTPTASATAYVPSESDAEFSASLSQTNGNAEAVCTQDNGR